MWQLDRFLQRGQQSLEQDLNNIINLLLFLIALPIVVLASTIEPTPIVYQQESLSYNITTFKQKVTELEIPTFTPNSVGISEPVIPPECECVRYLREVLGINIRGDAINIQPNIEKPFVGAVILLDFDGVGHAGLTKYVLSDRIIYQDSNFIRGYYFRNPNSSDII